MEIIDNRNTILKDDLQKEICKGSHVSIIASCFSIYAYQALKEELESVEELRFIFDSPTFTTEKYSKEKREFYIPRNSREKSVCGTEFEIKLRNELQQKAIAKECADWIRRKVKFKSNTTDASMNSFIGVNDKIYAPVNDFTTVGLGVEHGNVVSNFVAKIDDPVQTKAYIRLFESLWSDKETYEDVTAQVLDNITIAYNENSPEFIYFVALYNIFSEFLEDVSEDVLPNEATGYRNSRIWNLLYDFQKDAALAIINKLEKYNGCILADSVGLGKTFTALSVIKYYENRNKSVLVLCPKKLYNNWSTFKSNYKNNPIMEDRLRYDILFHTDISRQNGKSNGLDLSLINWGNYDLVVIDESHNFRNGGKFTDDPEHKDNRYEILMKNVIRAGVKTKVLMLSATPVNTKFTDLRNQLQLAYEGDPDIIDEKLDTVSSIDDIFKNAQKAFNSWNKLKSEERTTQRLLDMLDFDFFEVLDSVTIARSRKHIEKYYNTTDIGKFPDRLTPISLSPALTANKAIGVTYNEIFSTLCSLLLTVYIPSNYILPSKLEKYEDMYASKKGTLTQTGRELGIRRLTAINLMKRMESSVYSFSLTLGRIIELITNTITRINDFEAHGCGSFVDDYSQSFDESDDEMEGNEELFTIGNAVKIDIADMDYISWRNDMASDLDKLTALKKRVDEVTPENDEKLQTLISHVLTKIKNPINGDNKKVIIFTAFSDTADYLFANLTPVLKKLGIESGMVTGGREKTTLGKGTNDMNTILTLFSPLSKEKDKILPNDNRSIDVLIATDCISEGQNLQDCDYLINFDIHWNPVRIIQRFGRIDRIGSKNDAIQLVNFWPDVTLDEYINLKSRVESRMKIVDLAASADDNILSPEEKTELEYRKDQLERLKHEVVDLEDMNTGISIVDLGLNEFRLDLLDYVKTHPDMSRIPLGLNAVTLACDEDTPPGVIFVLKNRANSVNIDNQNRLHPFYLVYIEDDGQVEVNHLQPKTLLDRMRHLCKGKDKAIEAAFMPFNKETRDGKKMDKYSDLLSQAISSIIHVKEESDIESFLSGMDVSFSKSLNGLEDFELICFLVVR